MILLFSLKSNNERKEQKWWLSEHEGKETEERARIWS